MNQPQSRLDNAARLRSLRATLGIDQDEMGTLLGISREWVSKLENGREDFSEFVLMKMAAAGRTPKRETRAATSHEVNEAAAPYGAAGELRQDIETIFSALLLAAGDDAGRLGWIREQLRRHLAIPPHWDQNLHREMSSLVTTAYREPKPRSGKHRSND